MATLGSAQRAKLPDSAFAYIDAQGKRRLPIYDESHVRNTLARFNQVAFDDEEARDRARTRLLKAAKKYGIVPVGFISGQLRSVRELGRAGEPVQLPSGFVTMLMTDIEGSTALVEQLEDRYRALIDEVRTILRSTATNADGRVVETRADEFFAVFESPAAALTTAMLIQNELRTRSWADNLEVRVRVGIHCGYPTLNDANYIGLPVHIATAYLCRCARGPDHHLWRYEDGAQGSHPRRRPVQESRSAPLAGHPRRGGPLQIRGERAHESISTATDALAPTSGANQRHPTGNTW